MTEILLTNQEAMNAQTGLAYGGDNATAIAKAQLKKVAEWMEQFEQNEYYVFVKQEEFKALLKEVEDD